MWCLCVECLTIKKTCTLLPIFGQYHPHTNMMNKQVGGWKTIISKQKTVLQSYSNSQGGTVVCGMLHVGCISHSNMSRHIPLSSILWLILYRPSCRINFTLCGSFVFFSGARCSSRPPDLLGVLYPICSTHFDDSTFIIWQPDPAGNLPFGVRKQSRNGGVEARWVFQRTHLGYERVNVAGNREVWVVAKRFQVNMSLKILNSEISHQVILPKGLPSWSAPFSLS